jgi:dTDP-L-rhamnose 4-epimerase
MRILVTGGAGFIGSHVTDELAERGHQVKVLDRLHPKAHGRVPGYLRDDVEYVEGGLSAEILDAALDGVEAVCHQAAMVGLGKDLSDVEDYVRDNDLGTAALLAAVHRRGGQVRRLVLASSMVVYGEGAYCCDTHGPVRPEPRDPARLAAGAWEPPCPRCGRDLVPELVTEEAPLDPRSIYAATKLHQEHLAFAAMRAGGPDVTALRYHNVYGPRMPRDTPYAGVAAIFRSALEAGRPPQVMEDGRQRRDFVHVRDVAHANVLALESPEPVVGAFNIASGEPYTVGEMAAALAEAMDGPKPDVVGGSRPGDVRHVVASPALAEKSLGFRAKLGFGEGMREFATAPLRDPVPTAQTPAPASPRM